MAEIRYPQKPTIEDLRNNIQARETVKVYTGNELLEAIDETVIRFDWSIILNTPDKEIQKQLIYDSLKKPFVSEQGFPIDFIGEPAVFYNLEVYGAGPPIVSMYIAERNNTQTIVLPFMPFIGITPVLFTYNYTSDYGTFTITAENELIAYEKFQQWLKEKEAGILEPIPEPPVPVITEPEPVYVPATPIIQPTVDDSINTNMVTQQMINFNIVNGRAVGSIKFVATNNFNPYYYGRNIINIVQFKDPNGANILTTVKTNNLNFTETERDEVINYDEDMKGNTRATVESFVWEWIDKPAGAFSNMFSIEISEAEPPKPLTTGFMGAGGLGAVAVLVLIGAAFTIRGD